MAPLSAGQEAYVHVGELRLWCESFGEKEDPAILLIMGAGTQGIFWPTAFCERLANQGFFVLRYDHRDVGLSSPVDYEQTPYDLMDLTKDAVGILDAFAIPKAHIVGASMGGCITALFGAYFPDRAFTLTPMITSCDLGTVVDPTEPSSLPKPDQDCMNYLNETLVIMSSMENKEKIDRLVEGWMIYSGGKAHFDYDLYSKLVSQSLDRIPNPSHAENHFPAIKASLDTHKASLSMIHVPTLVIHGTSDPIFSVEHGEELARRITGAKLIFAEGMGHAILPFYYEQLIQAITSHARNEGNS